ncbi:MAG TPA: SDR family NAD(P)-dependent oxidoreductase [Candidatus Eisenbacteria bacterium]|nr:SDR family NAD(P)-dependent oxidoreductase [Candidatus Eisenbacteria bacterium]
MAPTEDAPLASGFQGRSALVVGGSRGLGRAVAIALAREGCRVLAVGRSAAPLAALRETAAARGLRLRTARGDVTRPGTARRLVRQAGALSEGGGRGRLGHAAPDIVVHAAGDYWEGPLRALTPERWEALVHSNVTGAVALLHAALPPMRRRRFGRVLLFGVAGGDMPRAASRAHGYRAAKIALLTIARSAAQEEAEHGITINVILPGVIRTPGTPARWAAAAAAAKIPARRLGTPGEVARAALFLLAEESGYITGAALPVSGGYLL